MNEVDQGIINLPSPFSVAETLDRLEALLKSKGVKVFARIDQRAEAQQAGLDMKPTQLLLFGNPQAGTPLMKAAPSIALDLPLKALAWESDAGQVWLSYNSFAYLQQRHGLSDDLIHKIAGSEMLMRTAVQATE
ncbi:MAG: DUF302 domain-containing protein [Chloroflexi bacterium]|nr:DUF302 domain-containing protein [Chloroflexota bacterium]